MITQEQIRELLYYDQDTGKFLWRVSRKGSKGKWNEAGTLTNKGYVDVCIEGKKYGLHRLAFLWREGWIPRCVDHINGDKADNSWNNLRPANYRENGFNCKGRGTITGFKNVYKDKRYEDSFYVSLYINGKQKRMGTYKTAEEANKAAIEMRIKTQGEFSNHN